MSPRRGVAAAVVLVMACIAAPGGAAADMAALLERMPGDSVRALGFVERQAMDSAHAAIAPGIVAARAAGDARALARWIRLDAQLDLQHGDGRAAFERLAEARALAVSARDTTLLLLVMRTEAGAQNMLGRYAQGRALAEAWIDLAHRSGNEEYLAWGDNMLGWLDQHAGALASARERSASALRRFTAISLPIGQVTAGNQLGNVLVATGDFGAAREAYARALPLARALGLRVLEARLLSNLGVVEVRLGDPAACLELYRASERLHAELGNNADRVISLDNIAMVMLELGRAEEACDIVEQAMEIVERTGLDLEIPWQHEALGHVYWAAGRRSAALRNWRAVLAMGDAAPVPARAGAVMGLAEACVEMDRPAAALGVIDSSRGRILEGADATVRARLALLRARSLERLGRPAEALAVARPLAAELDARGDAQYGLAAWVETARALRRLSRREEARGALDRASAAWWEARNRSPDPEFREMRGELGRELMAERVTLALEPPGARGDPAAVRAAFTGAQSFKTRTLLERLAGPLREGTSMAWLDVPVVTGERLQRELLRPGELLLDVVVARDSSWLFAFTREDARALRLGGEAALAEAAGLTRDLFATPQPGGLGASAAAARGLGAGLFSGITDLLAEAHTVIVAPDGPLHQVAFAALIPPGRGVPLLASHRVVMTPSAALLAALRTAPAARPAARPLFAYAAAFEPRAPRLDAAAAEVAALGRRFRNADVRILSPRMPDTLTVPRLAGFGILHFAGHIRANDQTPWRSGLAAAWPRGDDEGPLLTAGAIAAGRLDARIVVLSGCESAGGRARTGEGVAGLTSAFLAAGVPAVVATLWPVDDETTRRLMRHFYDGLQRGDDAATALAAAASRLREDPATAHPFYWAGYVLVGEGTARAALEPRRFGLQHLFAGLALVALAGFVPAARRGWRLSAAAPRTRSPM